MALVVTPSIDWPRRTSVLTGNEDLLKQNPISDLAPQEERIPASLLAHYALNIYSFEDPSGEEDFYTGNTVANYFNHLATTLINLQVSGAVSTLIDNGDGTYTHNNGVGVIRTINVNAINSYIVDTLNYFTGSTVEQALTQIGYYITSPTTTFTIVDTNNYFTGTTIEEAFEEIGYYLNNPILILQKTSDYTLTDSDDIILANASGSPIDITLHNGAKVKKYTIKVTDFSEYVTVTPASGLIDGNASYDFAANNEAITVVPYGGNWYII